MAGVDLVLGCPICNIIVQQYASFASLCISSGAVGVAGVSAVPCGVSEETCIATSGLVSLPIVTMKCMTVSVAFVVLIAKRGRSSSSGVVSALLARDLKNAPALGLFLLAQ